MTHSGDEDDQAGIVEYQGKLLRATGRPLDADARILDLGCGRGQLVRAFLAAGYPNVYGCDFEDELGEDERLSPIERPYRLPYPAAHFHCRGVQPGVRACSGLPRGTRRDRAGARSGRYLFTSLPAEIRTSGATHLCSFWDGPSVAAMATPLGHPRRSQRVPAGQVCDRKGATQSRLPAWPHDLLLPAGDPHPGKDGVPASETARD